MLAGIPKKKRAIGRPPTLHRALAGTPEGMSAGTPDGSAITLWIRFESTGNQILKENRSYLTADLTNLEFA